MAIEQATRRRISTRQRDQLLAIALRVGFLIAVLLVWQLLGDDSRRISFPTPVRVVTSFVELVRDDALVPALADSNLALVVGYLLALMFGLPLGLFMGTVNWFGKIARPYVTVLIAVPMIAMLPLIQAVFGIGFEARVIVIFVFSFVFISLNTEVGVRSASRDLLEMSASFRATRLQRLITIVLPQAVPAISSGARLALGRGIAGMVLAELFLVSSGIGSMLAFQRSRYDSGAVFAIVLTLILEGVLVMTLARWIEKRLVRSEGER